MSPEDRQLLHDLADRLNRLERSDNYRFQKKLSLQDGINMEMGTNKGTKIGLSSSKLSFFGAATVAKQGAISSPSGGTTVDSQARTAIDSIRTVLTNLGLTA